MKIHLTLGIFLTLFVLQAKSQCSKTYSSSGVYPSQLPNAYEQVSYSQEIDFSLPADTVINSQNIHIDSIKVNSVTGFPGTNFSYICGVASCIYTPNTNNRFQGCFTITGVAPKASAGSYTLKVNLDGYIQTPFGPQVYTIEDTSVSFIVDTCRTITTTISSADSVVCDGDTAILQATGNGKFAWWKDGSLKMTDTTGTAYAMLSGAYQAVLIDTTGCTDTSRSLTVVVNTLPIKPTLTSTGFNSATCAITGTNYRWLKNGQLDTSFNGLKTINITQKAHYQCSYEDANQCWSAYSDSLEVKTGIISNYLVYSANIIPNPSSGIFQLRVNNQYPETYTITIVDMKGAIVSALTISGADLNIPIDMANQPSGIYTISINGNKGSALLRATINH